jgi:hypothetical protein
MSYRWLWRWAGLLWLPLLACTLARVTPQPAASVEQHTFEVQTATPTIGFLADAPTDTPDPNFTPTPTVTTTPAVTASLTLTASVTLTTTRAAEATKTTPESVAVVATATATPVPVPTTAPLRGGPWDFEEGFAEWRNPHGDQCPGSGLAAGWVAFTSKDQYGSSCMNQTDWAGNVYSGENAQEITFAYVGVEAGVFRSAPTSPGHRYTVEAYMKREFSPTKVEMSLGLDPTGGVDWQAASVQWFPWQEDLDDEWARTEATLTASGESMTIFLKGAHAYPEPGGTLRLDAVSITDLGPE